MKQNVDISLYLSLYSPALDWIVQNVTSHANDIQLEELLIQCKEKKNNSLLLLTLMHSFRPEFISLRAVEIVSILADANSEGITKGTLFRQLGNIVSLFPPPVDQRVAVFNEAWKTVNTITNIGDYMSCIELWSQYIASNFDTSTIDQFFGEIISRVTPRRAFERHYIELQGIVDKVVSNVKDFHGFLNMVKIYIFIFDNNFAKIFFIFPG